MKWNEFFVGQLDREAAANRKALGRVPEGKGDWTPHDKSMPLGYLSNLVATMPSWIAMAIRQDELDLAPAEGAQNPLNATNSTSDLLKVNDGTVEEAREALWGTSDGHLMTPWKLLVAGTVVLENPRQVVIADTFTHLAHHRGQLTVYLRLLGEPVPAIYGPSADDKAW